MHSRVAPTSNIGYSPTLLIIHHREPSLVVTSSRPQTLIPKQLQLDLGILRRRWKLITKPSLRLHRAESLAEISPTRVRCPAQHGNAKKGCSTTKLVSQRRSSLFQLFHLRNLRLQLGADCSRGIVPAVHHRTAQRAWLRRHRASSNLPAANSLWLMLCECFLTMVDE